MRNFLNFLRNLNPNTWIRIGLWILFSVIFITGMKSCSGGTSGQESSVGNGIWILMGGGLIISAVISRERVWLAGTMVGLAGLIFLVLLGKFNNLFSWSVIGLPAFAAAGIWGVTKTDGRIRSFLSFASGITILYWLFLFYLGHPIGDFGFIGKQFFADETTKSIFVIFLAVFLFAVWKKSKIFYLISFIVLLSFLGNGMINGIINHFPQRLTPSISHKYKHTWENIEDKLLNKINSLLTEESASSSVVTSQARLVATVTKSTNRFARSLSDGTTLGPGKYFQSPKGKTAYQFSDERSPRVIGDGENFTVPPGKKLIGARTRHRLIKIYRIE